MNSLADIFSTKSQTTGCHWENKDQDWHSQNGRFIRTHYLEKSGISFLKNGCLIFLKFKITLVQIEFLSTFANKMLLVNIFIHFITFKHFIINCFVFGLFLCPKSIVWVRCCWHRDSDDLNVVTNSRWRW